MPFTYNGIGTRYAGKKNVQTRSGQCRACGAQTQLSSYDTRLWFVILFIPIIPLARKRIIDACPVCRRLFVADLHKWDAARQLEVSGAMEKFRSAPSVENAMAAHKQMLDFHQLAEAAEFEKTITAQFSDSANLFAYLGSAYEHFGKFDEAGRYYGDALKLRSDLPGARIGVAQAYIRGSRLEEARALLDFLEKPGAGQLYPLGALETLALAYQKTGAHQKALELFGELIRELPKVAEHPGFRKAVKQSEKAVNATTSILPRQKFSLKRMFQWRRPGAPRLAFNKGFLIVVGVVAVLIVIGLFIGSEVARRHRKVYIVNALDTIVPVTIDGTLFKGYRGEVVAEVPEGHHHVVIGSPANREFDFEIRGGFFERISGHTIWVINVGGLAVLEEVIATYSKQPGSTKIRFHTGHVFERMDGVTHPFQTLPKTVTLHNENSVTLVSVELFRREPTLAFNNYVDDRDLRGAMNFAEDWLRYHEDNQGLLEDMVSTALRGGESNHLDRILSDHLTNRPVRTELHRFYQHLHDNPDEHAGLVVKYEALVAAEPTNAALVYLRGRLESNHRRAMEYFKNSLALDPNNPFASYAIGYDSMANGDWDKARPLLARAVASSPDTGLFGSSLFMTRLALGEAPALEFESHKKLKESPLSFDLEMELFEALAAEGKTNELRDTADQYCRFLQSQAGDKAAALIHQVRYEVFLKNLDFTALKQEAARDQTTVGRAAEAIALMMLGDTDEAAKVITTTTGLSKSPLFPLALAAMARFFGNEQQATTWEKRGIEVLEQSDADRISVAALLKRGVAPTQEEVANMVIDPTTKALILAMLSQKYPDERARFVAGAKKLNIERGYIYPVVVAVVQPAP